MFGAAQSQLEVERLPGLARARGNLLPIGAAIGVIGADRDPFRFPPLQASLQDNLIFLQNVWPTFWLLASIGSSTLGLHVHLFVPGIVG